MFSSVKTKTNSITCRKEQPFIFTVYLMNHIFQTSVLIMESIELNWLCKHIKNIRSSQPVISLWVSLRNFISRIVFVCQFIHIHLRNFSGRRFLYRAAIGNILIIKITKISFIRYLKFAKKRFLCKKDCEY